MTKYGIKILHVGWARMIEEWYTINGKMYTTDSYDEARAMILNAKNSVHPETLEKVWVEEL